MRLRERELLKAPQRYGEEICIAPTRQSGASVSASASTDKTAPPATPVKAPRPRIMPATARPSFTPPYIDYDPNAPPAAFPTIDRPRATTEKYSENPRKGRQGEPQQSGFPDIGKGLYSNGFRDDSEYDSEVMRQVESTDDGSETDDEQYVEVEDYKDLRTRPDVGWQDISPIMQTEIVQNLAQIYSSVRITSLLQLSDNEQDIVFGHSESRDAQLKSENKRLKEMREKQLRALLRIDNTVLRRSRVPDQLVFRNISKQYLRDRKVRPEPDFLMVQASELLAARKYLRNIGLDPQFAGEWKNDLATIQRSGQGHEDEGFRWTLDSDKPAEQNAFARPSQQSMGSSPQGSPSKSNNLSPQVHFINHFGGPNGAACEVPLYSKSDRFMKTPLNAAQHILGRRKTHNKRDRHSVGHLKVPNGDDGAVVRLKIGPEGAAQIQNVSLSMPSSPPSPPSPTKGLNWSPQLPPQPGTTDDNPTRHFLGTQRPKSRKRRHSTSTIPNLGSPSSIKQDDNAPLSRTLSGAWWYHVGPTEQSPEPTSSQRLTERLLAVRAESELKHVNSLSSVKTETPKKRLLDLPFRSSPPPQLPQDIAACETENPFKTPQKEQLDQQPSTFNTPTKQSNTHAGLEESIIDYVQSNSSGNFGSEEVHGPEYSPISPRSVAGPNTEEPAENAIEQGQDTDPMDVDTSHPTDQGNSSLDETQATMEKYECPPNQTTEPVILSETREEYCLNQSPNPLVESNCENTQEDPLISLTDSQKIQNNDDNDGGDGSKDEKTSIICTPDAVDENQKNTQDISSSPSFCHTEINMECETTPSEGKYEKPQSKKKATTKKRVYSNERRRSARLNPPGRVLRPRPE